MYTPRLTYIIYFNRILNIGTINGLVNVNFLTLNQDQFGKCNCKAFGRNRTHVAANSVPCQYLIYTYLIVSYNETILVVVQLAIARKRVLLCDYVISDFDLNLNAFHFNSSCEEEIKIF